MEERIKDALFKIFILAIIEFTCIILYFTISGISGNFDWTIERLTGSFEGILIQIINLIVLINGMIIFVYIIITIILLIKT
ncbi:MAG: hypothetical protein ACFFKA_17870 [Candidatus Thorarchaeota archaeon]